MEKIFEQSKDLHVRSVIVFGDSDGNLWANEDPNFPISLDPVEVMDAFEKGMLVIKNDNSFERPISATGGSFITVVEEEAGSPA